jgi:hypothetical protein
MIRTTVFLMVLIAGCTAIQLTENSIQPPELVKSFPLPPIVSDMPGGRLKFTVMLLVLKDGTVGKVSLPESLYDPEWDSLAIHSIMKWQFNPALQDGKPVDLWLRQPLVVQFRDPIIRNLAGLISGTEREADSLYALLEHGLNFDTLLKHAVQVSGERSSSIGAVDISVYARTLRGELLKLREGDVSRPLRIGNRFVIYKRLKNEPA